MAFHRYGETEKFPRSEDVDIHVREVTLNPDSKKSADCVEIREYLKEGEVYGHGLVIPWRELGDLEIAIQRLRAKREKREAKVR